MSDPLKGLEVRDLIGVFYYEDDCLMVADEFDGTVAVAEALDKFIDQEVRLLAHHRPIEPPVKDRWGGGCCLLENVGECHFGHRENPGLLYTFNAAGILRHEAGVFRIDQADEMTELLNAKALTGHRSQIVVTSIPDLDEVEEKVRSFDPSNIENPTIENLTERLGEIREFLVELDELKKNIDG